MSYTWFKLHHELPDDIKLRRFTPQEKWAWVVLLCLASKGKIRGMIDADDDDIAEYCEFNSTQDWLYFRDKLIAKGMLEIGGAGWLEILHWNDRQYENPSDQPEAVKARVRKHRAKQKEQHHADETPCNALLRTCNADETPQTRSDQSRQDEKRSEKKPIKEQGHDPEVHGQTTLPDGTTRNACLAPAPTKKPKPTKARSSFDEQAWLATYNASKPPGWPECKGLKSAARTKGVNAALSACGGDEQEALKTFRAALLWIQAGKERTKFWREGCTPSFEVLLRPTTLHFLALGEQGLSKKVGSAPQSSTPKYEALPQEDVETMRHKAGLAARGVLK